MGLFFLLTHGRIIPRNTLRCLQNSLPTLLKGILANLVYFICYSYAHRTFYTVQTVALMSFFGLGSSVLQYPVQLRLLGVIRLL